MSPSWHLSHSCLFSFCSVRNVTAHFLRPLWPLDATRVDSTNTPKVLCEPWNWNRDKFNGSVRLWWLKDMIFFPPEPSKFQLFKEITEVWCHKLLMEIDWAPEGWDRKCFVMWYPVPRTTHRQILKCSTGTILSCFVKLIFFPLWHVVNAFILKHIHIYTNILENMEIKFQKPAKCLSIVEIRWYLFFLVSFLCMDGFMWCITLHVLMYPLNDSLSITSSLANLRYKYYCS